MSLDDVAKVTKIQPRILERLEAGKLEGLPADVFVRGFVRSFARCVGLDESEALRRYASCGLGVGSQDLTPTVRALVEAMVDLAPGAASGPRATPRRMTAVEVIDLAGESARDLPASGTVVETMMLPETGTVVMPAQLTASVAEAMTDSEAHAEASPAVGAAPQAQPADAGEVPASSSASLQAVEPPAATTPAGETSKKKRRRGKGRNKRTTSGPGTGASLATGTPASPSPVVTAPVAPVAHDAPVAAGDHAAKQDAPAEAADAAAELSPVAAAPAAPAVHDEPVATEIWAPKMPPIAAPSVPWRRPAYAGSAAPVIPTLVIDDADPDSAERVLEERAETLAPRRSFLPPILLDREDRSARQGGLTLAVIILLIAATLTLSYLMRRPSASGDGMTRLETPASYLG